MQSGLWSMSRHPNYFAEQSIWIVFYLFSVSGGAGLINWTIIGAILYVLLFQGSVAFSEGITAGKYPRYAEYQATVPLFIPNPTMFKPFWNDGATMKKRR
uniref:Steroid 5-alpha reductase C-terminal domain-containing protein n=1 Tax=Lotharella globosa TaxID=91324 RepID=A0A7S3YUT6_9EUKA